MAIYSNLEIGIYSPAMKPEELTLIEAMRILGIKTRVTMRKYADSGRIPCRREPSGHMTIRVFKKKDILKIRKYMDRHPGKGFPYLPSDK